MMNSSKLMLFGPLPIRILVGIAFIIHGLPKLSDIAGSQGFFGSVGLPPDLAVLIGLLEVIGGIFLLVGVLTRITAALFVMEMIGAILTVKTLNRTRKNIYRMGCIEQRIVSTKTVCFS
jgi:putative oxidoreductase